MKMKNDDPTSSQHPKPAQVPSLREGGSRKKEERTQTKERTLFAPGNFYFELRDFGNLVASFEKSPPTCKLLLLLGNSSMYLGRSISGEEVSVLA